MDKGFEKAKALLDNYLHSNKMRRTPERLYLLACVYQIEGHFRVDDLHKKVQEEKKMLISLATIYNTIQLFNKANVIIKHPSTSESIYYEKTLSSKPIYKKICLECGRESVFKDVKLNNYLNSKSYKHFKPQYQTVFLYGLCYFCNRKKRKKNIKQRK